MFFDRVLLLAAVAASLAYLNNPMAEGKSYCGGTTVRKGWKEVSCEKERPEQKGSGPVGPGPELW
jgi:hypothetical protein